MGQRQRQRAAIYCRISTAEQNCGRQLQDLEEFAARSGYEVVGNFLEIASGAKDNRPERAKILALVQARKIDTVLVTELTRWGRSTIDLINTLRILQDRGVSLIAQSGLEFNLTTPQGKLIATLMAGLAEFERDLIRERVRSGIAAAKSRGVRFGRRPGETTPGVQAKVSQVLKLNLEGYSYREIAKRLKLSKNTVMKIVRESRINSQASKVG
jgi:DNA invertase Pin-like site-specific DNA recombinase